MPTLDSPLKQPRITMVDALRGFAICAIILLHNIEHFNYFVFPANEPQWIQSLNDTTFSSLFFLFGGKAYAIFALLFGLSFYIQFNNQQRRGRDFRGRFAWRLVLLAGFGLGPQIGPFGTFILTLVILAIQIGISRWWLGRHRYGPLEALKTPY